MVPPRLARCGQLPPVLKALRDHPRPKRDPGSKAGVSREEEELAGDQLVCAGASACRCGVNCWRPNCCSSCSSGRKPTTPCGWWPGRKNAIVGMLMMLKACERAGLASTSTLTTSTAPSYLAASFSISGATILHGPHHAAQKSTTTRRSLLSTSSSKFASVATLMSAIVDCVPFSAGAVDALAGDRLDHAICLEHALVRKAIENGAPVSSRGHQAGCAQHRQVLAHVRHLATDVARQVAHGTLAA